MKKSIRSMLNLTSSTRKGTRRFSTRILMLSLFSLVILSGCATGRTHYFNESDKVIAGTAKEGVCSGVAFDCVVMSQGTFRDLTTVNTSVKPIYVEQDKKQ
jgi:hypothetical protein